MNVMAEPDLLGRVPSTMKPPTAKELRHFHLGQISPQDTVRFYLTEGYSLGICCKDCRRLTEWTPADLCERFGKKPDIGIRDIAARLKCSNEKCGSSDVAVFPHLFDGIWTWR